MWVDLESDYWKALRDAMNTRASNGFRAQAARAAIAAYHSQTEPIEAVLRENLDSMDSTVTGLVEAANRIRDERARVQATEIARQAREMVTGYWALVPLYQRRFQLQLDILQDMVSMGGALSAIVAVRYQSEEIKALNAESERTWRGAINDWDKTRDTFSALEGAVRPEELPWQVRFCLDYRSCPTR